MPIEEDLPRTFREVGIFLRYLKNDIRDVKDEVREDLQSVKDDVTGDIREVKEEVDSIKRSLSKIAGLIFTALIAPIIVGIIVAYVMLNAR